MRERPIIFSAESVRAILNGSKSQTRRVVKPQPSRQLEPGKGDAGYWFSPSYHSPGWRCLYGKPGDRLIVREGWRWYGRIREPGMVEGGFEYRADGTHRKFTDFADPEDAWEQFQAAAVNEAYHWRPSIHMPRWASRITLELTEVRVERLQDITEEDAIAEGCRATSTDTFAQSARAHYFQIWDELNGKKYPWAHNPWVWVLSFRRVEQ